LDWVLGGAGAATAVAGGAGVVRAAAKGAKAKSDPLAEWTAACSNACWLKTEWEPQAGRDVEAARAQLAQIDQAYFKALSYLDNQLREDYLFLRKIHMGAASVLWMLPSLAGAPFGLGVLALVGAAGFAGAWITEGSEDESRRDVLAQQKSAHALIDGIHDKNRDPWQAKLEEALARQDEAFNSRHALEVELITLKASNPGVTFPDECLCKGVAL
jgi:hypothetical protein